MNEGSNPEITVHVGTFMEQTETYIHVASEAFSKNVIVFFSDNVSNIFLHQTVLVICMAAFQ